MAVLTDCGHDESANPTPDAEARIRNLLSVDLAIAPGGILLRDTETGSVIAPGCCFGLETWRDWIGLMNGNELWLGHDTATHTEHREAVVRMWPQAAPPTTVPVDIPLSELPDLLRTVQDKLNGFLALAERWAHRYAPAPALAALALISKLDEDLNIGAPLEDFPDLSIRVSS